MAVAEASFKIENDSISFGLIEDNPLFTGKPSITTKGSLDAPNEAPPLIRIAAPSPGRPP